MSSNEAIFATGGSVFSFSKGYQAPWIPSHVWFMIGAYSLISALALLLSKPSINNAVDFNSPFYVQVKAESTKSNTLVIYLMVWVLCLMFVILISLTASIAVFKRIIVATILIVICSVVVILLPHSNNVVQSEDFSSWATRHYEDVTLTKGMDAKYLKNGDLIRNLKTQQAVTARVSPEGYVTLFDFNDRTELTLAKQTTLPDFRSLSTTSH